MYTHEYTHVCIAQIGFMQDNDPKHTSIFAWDFITDNCINWWKTRVKHPDLNLIENTWHELKESCMREVKPTTEQELIDGTVQFWETITVEKCKKKYINHKLCHALLNFKGLQQATNNSIVCTWPNYTFIHNNSTKRRWWRRVRGTAQGHGNKSGLPFAEMQKLKGEICKLYPNYLNNRLVFEEKWTKC